MMCDTNGSRERAVPSRAMIDRSNGYCVCGFRWSFGSGPRHETNAYNRLNDCVDILLISSL